MSELRELLKDTQAEANPVTEEEIEVEVAAVRQALCNIAFNEA